MFCVSCVFSWTCNCINSCHSIANTFLFVALPPLELHYQESASTDALSVSCSGYSLLVVSKLLKITFLQHLILEPKFPEPCLHLSDVHIISQNWPLGWFSLLSTISVCLSVCLSVCMRHHKTWTSKLVYCELKCDVWWQLLTKFGLHHFAEMICFPHIHKHSPL